MGYTRERALHTIPIRIVAQTFCILILLVYISSAAVINSDGWQKLVDNKPFEAQKIFSENTTHSDNKTAGEAFRGLAFTFKFLGEYDTTMALLFKSFLADKDTLLFNAAWINILSFGRDWIGHTLKDGYKVMKMITRKPSLYTGDHLSQFIDRYVNDGKISKARKLVNRMGIVRTFRMIGPFDNISGSGYKKIFPPEKEINFSKKYSGKDGAEALWFPFHNHKTNGWVFTEYNFNSSNAILYYYSNVYSKKEQDVFIGFGASGSFKVFLNDNIVLADSVFRNTGTDMFMQKVRLFKGENKLLIKIGHELKNSNFLVRFMDDQGKALPSVTYKNTPGAFKTDTTLYKNLSNSPLTERIEQVLLNRLKEDPKNLESAILLMDFYNASELTKKGQKLARSYLKRYPNSSLLHSMFSESLMRSRKITETQTELNTAFKLCKYNYSGWSNELEVLANSAGTREVMDFISKSYVPFKNTPQALLYTFGHYAKITNETEAMAVIEKLNQQYFHLDVVINILVSIYIGQGKIKKAETLLKRFLKWERTSSDVYSLLAGTYLKMGQRFKAVKTYLESLAYSPNAPGFYYYLANLALQYKEYASALEYIKKACAISPTSSTMISLKGTILNAQGNKEAAIDAFKESIRYTYNNFDAWDQLLPLEGKSELTTLTKLPVATALRSEAASWEYFDNEDGAILAYTRDIFLYPSRCSRERRFIMVHLPTQNAIDIWKEYSISYNSYYQIVNITRAYAINASGTETPADISRNMIVFKTLQPGDFVVMEWTTENYYQQDMARQVWGEHDFSLPYPVFKTELRLVTPRNDTIPYTVRGDSITIRHRTVKDYSVITFSRNAYRNPPLETYSLIDPPESGKVFYSTFSSWADIANWYLNLIENKLDQTFELQSLADSLLTGITSPQEKVVKIHHYITDKVRYSFIPFRQSAWIPQPARAVLATKIGDCKDMSSLGKSLLDYAGIESNLVLVNTSDRNSIFPTYIGPNFNHCILSYSIDGTRNYLDMTDNNLSANGLPRMDQGSLALIIDKNKDSLIHLPVDDTTQRQITRTITSVVNDKGTLKRNVETVKNGVFAGTMRSNYRFDSYTERAKKLKQILVKSFPNAVVDTFVMYDLDSLRDTIRYIYAYSAKNAAQFSGNTVLLPLNIPDKISGAHYPSEETRTYAIDMSQTWFGIGKYSIQGTLTVPEKWRLINVPEPVSLSGKWGTYSLSVVPEGNTISYTREATFNFNNPVAIEKAGELRSTLAQIAQADNIQLMFYYK